MIGEILDGKYRIDKHLGAGGMGHVYLATHLGTTRVVAIKVIAPKWASEPQFLARFQREAQACGRLRHPNIVNVTDFGIAKSANGDMPYLVMEFLDGQTLSDFQESNPQLPLPMIADLLDQIGLALTEAHRHGVVHRDLKPDNIWLEPNGRGGYTAKVLDFGVAKVNLLGTWAPPAQAVAPAAAPQSAAQGDGAETVMIATTPGEELETVAIAAPTATRPPSPRPLVEDAETAAMEPTPSSSSSGSFDSSAGAQTMPGSLLGTPAYMSPEQAFGKEIDYRSDIYALAVVAYLLVCGVLPYTRASGDLYEYHQSGKPVPPANIRKIPRDVSDAILAGLARNPADRPASAVAFARRFHNAVDAEFLALRRSKAFLMQHLTAFILLIAPIYTVVLSLLGVLVGFSGRLMPVATLRVVVVPLFAAGLFIFSNNQLRAATALMAVDEQVRVRRFLTFRVFWRLIKMTPVLVMTQAAVSFGPGWVIGDCLWPVVAVVERRSGAQAIQRSRELMTGLRSAGRALAIRHLALAALAIAEAVKSLSLLLRGDSPEGSSVVATAVWFPIFALYAAAPLFLYDRTAANESGPLLQLDRTPEVQTTARMFSLSSMLWLAAGVVYLLFHQIWLWFFHGR